MIAVEKANYPVSIMCRVLNVSRSGFYESLKRQRPTAREVTDAEDIDEIRSIHEASRGTYGSPRVHAKLRRNGHEMSKGRVARLMKAAGLSGRVKRRFRVTTDSNHTRPVAANVLNREFSRETPDSAWCADITYIPTGAGWVYLAVVLDLATRLVVGWSMATHMRTDLVTSALKNALAIRKPAKEIIHHSDRGSQYASDEYQDLLNAHGILCSMSRVGNCWDNAVMESFFGTFKQEWANLQRWRGLDDAKLSTLDFIEVFYNCERLHSSLGYMTPAEADAAAA